MAHSVKSFSCVELFVLGTVHFQLWDTRYLLTSQKVTTGVGSFFVVTFCPYHRKSITVKTDITKAATKTLVEHWNMSYQLMTKGSWSLKAISVECKHCWTRALTVRTDFVIFIVFEIWTSSRRKTALSQVSLLFTSFPSVWKGQEIRQRGLFNKLFVYVCDSRLSTFTLTWKRGRPTWGSSQWEVLHLWDKTRYWVWRHTTTWYARQLRVTLILSRSSMKGH